MENLDYNEKQSSATRFLEVTEKLQREPDVLIVDMPPCRMVTSGLLSDDTEQEKFNAMWRRISSKIADKINPRDFMYHDSEHDQEVWLFLIEDWVTEAETEIYDIITFEGGLFATAIADSWESIEYDRVYKGIKSWLSRQEHLELDEEPNRHLLFHFAGPHSAKLKEWIMARFVILCQ